MVLSFVVVATILTQLNMAGENTTIKTYRMALDTVTGKKQYSLTPHLNGVAVTIQVENLQKAQAINQQNMLRTYRMTSDDNLDIKESDKAVDHFGGTYIVHSVQKEMTYNGASQMTIAVLTRSENV